MLCQLITLGANCDVTANLRAHGKAQIEMPAKITPLFILVAAFFFFFYMSRLTHSPFYPSDINLLGGGGGRVSRVIGHAVRSG